MDNRYDDSLTHHTDTLGQSSAHTQRPLGLFTNALQRRRKKNANTSLSYTGDALERSAEMSSEDKSVGSVDKT